MGTLLRKGNEAAWIKTRQVKDDLAVQLLRETLDTG